MSTLERSSGGGSWRIVDVLTGILLVAVVVLLLERLANFLVPIPMMPSVVGKALRASFPGSEGGERLPSQRGSRISVGEGWRVALPAAAASASAKVQIMVTPMLAARYDDLSLNRLGEQHEVHAVSATAYKAGSGAAQGTRIRLGFTPQGRTLQTCLTNNLIAATADEDLFGAATATAGLPVQGDVAKVEKGPEWWTTLASRLGPRGLQLLGMQVRPQWGCLVITITTPDSPDATETLHKAWADFYGSLRGAIQGASGGFDAVAPNEKSAKSLVRYW